MNHHTPLSPVGSSNQLSQVKSFVSGSRSTLLVVTFLIQLFMSNSLFGQYLIEGQIKQPTTRYMVFLSILENWDQFNTIGQDMIIKEAIVDSSGYFRFSGNELSSKTGFYRIHFSATGEPGVMMTGETVNKNYVNFIHSNLDSIRFEFEQMHYAPGQLSVSSTHPASEKFFHLSTRKDLLIYSADQNEYANYNSLIEEKQRSIMRAALDSSHSPLISMFALYSIRNQLSEEEAYFQEVLAILADPEIFPSYKSSLEKYIGAKRYQDLQNENRLLKILLGLAFATIVGVLIYGLVNRVPKVIKEKSLQSELLTSKENQVVKLILAHKTNKEIAGELFISDSTVKTHINNIYRKLNTKTRKEIFERFPQNL